MLYRKFFSTCILLFITFYLSDQTLFAQQKKDRVLWYKQPAKDWNEALPIGNGRLGAMIFGGVNEELIQLNEATLWTGGPVDHNPNPAAPLYLQAVRDALFRDSINEAINLLHKIQGPNSQMYQPLGDIILKQQFSGKPSAYYRDLNISTATSTTRFSVEGVTYTREIFSSAPDQVIIMRLQASKANALNFSVNVHNELAYRKMVTTCNELVLKGKARITNDERRSMKPFIYSEESNCSGMRFEFRIKAVANDGTVTNTDSSLIIANASEVIL